MMLSPPCGTTPDAGCGARLRCARESAGLSRDDVSARLKVPARVIGVLESGDWSSLGAPVFARGQLRSYARLLRLDIEADLAKTPVALVTPPELISHTHIPRLRRVAEQVGRRAIYIAVTAAIAVPVWMATSPHLGSNRLSLQSLDPPATTSAPVPSPPGTSRTPVIASFASLAPPATAVLELSLTINNDSWVEVFASDGRTLEQSMLRAGQSRRYRAGEVGRLVIGNANAVTVMQGGMPMDLSPFSRANVARITLSSDGSLAPVSP